MDLRAELGLCFVRFASPESSESSILQNLNDKLLRCGIIKLSDEVKVTFRGSQQGICLSKCVYR